MVSAWQKLGHHRVLQTRLLGPKGTGESVSRILSTEDIIDSCMVRLTIHTTVINLSLMRYRICSN